MEFFIPQTMKDINNWVVWEKEGKEYIKKIPYNPKTGYRTNPTKSCCCFKDAISIYKNSDRFDGIGFCFTKDCNMTFIDLDNCINENNEFSSLAKEMQEMFSDCYIEYSQSQKGIHIICLGTVARAIKTKTIEIYSSGRYVALTGNSINPKEPLNAQERLDILINKYTSISPATHYSNTNSLTPSKLLSYSDDINSIIKVIINSHQGEKWQNLHSGNLNGYQSTSEAAQAYIAIINYFTGGDEILIKEIFSRSTFPQIHIKYKNDYYIDRMIKNAKNTLFNNQLTKKTRKRSKLIDMKEIKRKRF